jgi:hypothetical protein
MPYALISPEEKSGNGARIAQLAGQPFDVALPLFWKECPVDLYYGAWFYDSQTDQFVNASQPINLPEVP